MLKHKKRILRIVIPLIMIVLLSVSGRYVWNLQNHEQTDSVFYGNVDLREVELAFLLQERVTKLYVEEGATVEPGQLLAELDPIRFQHIVEQREAELEVAKHRLAVLEQGSRPQEIRRAEAELNSARAAEKDARITYRRVKKLVEQKLVPPQDVDDARADLDVALARLNAAKESYNLIEEGPRKEDIALARAQVRAAEAAGASARKNLADTRLLSPSRGVIQARILEPGDIATPQRPVFTLALLDPLWVRAYVSEADLGRIHQGMPVDVITDSFPGKRYHGWIGYISPSAEFTPKSVQTREVRSDLVYQVRAFVCDPQNELRLGMPAEVHLTVAQDTGPNSTKNQNPCSKT